MTFCPKCGAQLPDGRQFCPQCGAPLAAASPASPAAPAPGAYAPGPQQPAQFPRYPEPPRRTSQRVGQPAQYGGQYAAVQQDPPAFDWTRLQPRTRTGGASALIAGVTLLLLAAVMLLWGMSL